MTRLRFTFKNDEEEKKEKFGWEQRTRGIGELPDLVKQKEEPLPEIKPTGKLEFTDAFKAQVGIGAKAVGGATLPETEQPSTSLDLGIYGKFEPEKWIPKGVPEELQTTAQSYIKSNANAWKTWFKELQVTPDKIKFLKGENWSPELKTISEEAKVLGKKASELGVNPDDWIKTGVYAGFFTTLAATIYPIVKGLPANILNKIAFKVEGKTVKGKELLKILQRVRMPESVWPKAGFGEPSKFDKKVFAKFVEEGGIKSVTERFAKGITITEVTPRFAFAGKLYAGLPADEIVKSIVEGGKVTASAVKDLDPVKVSQVTQQLLNINRALASEFLKAVEKVEVPKEALKKVEEPVIKEPTPKVEPKPPKEQLYAEKYGIPLEKVKVTELPKEKLKETVGEAEIRMLEEAVGKRFTAEEVLKKVREPEGKEPISKVTPKALEIGEKYTGKAYRAETYIPEHGAEIVGKMKTAQEKLDYDYGTTGNPVFKEAEKVAGDLGIELGKVPVKELVWVAPKLEIAEKYGEAEEYKLTEDTVILAKDDEGGLLVLKNADEYREPVTVGLTKEGKVEPLWAGGEVRGTEEGKAISKALEPLAEEARKYESAEEFKKLFTKEELPTSFGFALPDIRVKGKIPFILVEGTFYSPIGKTEEGIQKIKIPTVGQRIDATKKYIEEKYGSLTDFYNQATAKPAEPKAVVKPEVKREADLVTLPQIKKAHAIANSKALISDKGKMKPQYRKIAEIFTGKKSIKDMTPEQAEMFIDMLNRLPEPKYRNGKLVPPSIPRTAKLVTEGFFQKEYKEPTPIWLLTDQTYYATKLGIKPLVAPFEKGKQEFDLEFRRSSNLVDRMVNKLNQVAKTPGWERIKSKVKNIPTKAESKMAKLINKHEATPPGLSPKEEDIFKYFRNLSKDIWRRENEVREKVDLPPIKYKQAYFRHTANAMAKEMLEGKYPFPQGIKYWGEKMVGKKIFNPMEFHRKLSDDLIDLWSKDIRAVTKSMLWNGLKEIHLAQPAKFLNEQLNAISKDLPEYKNLTPREQAAYDQTRVIPASTKKWLINYVNQVLKGQETETDASLNRIVTQSGLKGIFDKVLCPFGRSIGRKPITNTFALMGRAIISGTMGWVPRQIMRNAFQPIQNLALYGVKATIKAFLPASVDKNLKELMSESLFLKSYTGYEELPTNLMAKLEKIWLGPYGIVAVNNAKLGMKAAYWNVLELIKNPKFKKHGWADPQRTKDTPKGFLYPSEKEKLSKEMEFGSSCTQYQYIPIGMPGVFRYKALIPLTRLQSWWMNYFTKFNREALHRGLKGKPSWSGEDGPTIPWSRRVNWLKYVIIGGAILTTLGYKRSFMLGVAPTYLSPAGQLVLGFYNYATADSDWKKKKALNQIYYSWKAFIPGSLAWRDFLAVWNGEKELNEILFYGKKEPKKSQPPLKITVPKGGKLKFAEPKLKIKSTKLKFNF